MDADLSGRAKFRRRGRWLELTELTGNTLINLDHVASFEPQSMGGTGLVVRFDALVGYDDRDDDVEHTNYLAFDAIDYNDLVEFLLHDE